jgi:chromosome segregation ATPase
MVEIKTIKTKVIENINELARKAQKKKAISVAAAVGTLILIGWVFMHTKKPVEKVEQKNAQTTKMAGIADAQFSETASQKALEEQQRQIKDLNDQLAAINNEMDVLQKALDEKETNDANSNQTVVQELQSRINELENSLKRSGSQIASGLNNIGTEARSITTTNFSYADDPQSTNAQICKRHKK